MKPFIGEFSSSVYSHIHLVLYRAFGWLYKYHPRTAIQNLPTLIEPRCIVKKEIKAHGYWKDLLNIVALGAVDQLSSGKDLSEFLHNYQTKDPKRIRSRRSEAERKVHPSTEFLADYERKQQAKSRQAHVSKNNHFHEALVNKLADPKFRALYIMVARLFADKLAGEVALLDSIEALPAGKERDSLAREFSWVGKWAPTPRKSHDRVTNLSTAISLLLHHSHSIGPTLSRSRDDGLSSSDAHVLRSFYRRWVLMPLRRVLRCPEPLMSANRWKEISYSRIPSVSMKQNMPHFYKHDQAGFEAYLTAVEDGKRKISGATLMPHEIVMAIMKLQRAASWQPAPGKPDPKDIKKLGAQAQMRALEAQWKSLVDSLREAGALDNSLALCDVSGSMGHINMAVSRSGDTMPILPALSLSLIISQVAKPPFANHFITFSANPHYVEIDPSLRLADALERMNSAHWDQNTDFNAVFLKLLLPLAKANNVKQEDMIKRIFVFSDMHFDDSRQEYGSDFDEDQAAAEWETNHDTVERAFKEAGYEMPQIVYWNLCATRTVSPVQHNRKGVALMNGFSPALLKTFLEEPNLDKLVEDNWVSVGAGDDADETAENDQDDFNPVNVMKKALMKPSFDGLLVVD